MMEKIKNIYGAHPIGWTLGLLALVIAIAALIFYYPAFSLEAVEIPAHACEPAPKGEEIPVGGVITVELKYDSVASVTIAPVLP